MISNEVLAEKIDALKELLIEKISNNHERIELMESDFGKFKFKTIADITWLKSKVNYKIALAAALPGTAAAIYALVKAL